MKAIELYRVLLRLGWTPTGAGKGSHERLVHPDHEHAITFSFPKKELAGGLVKKILMKDARLTKDEAWRAVHDG